MQTHLPLCTSSCEAALSKAGTAQSQSLFEAYARLQQLRGQAVSIPHGTAATSERTSKVRAFVHGCWHVCIRACARMVKGM